MNVQPQQSGRPGVTIEVDPALEAGELRDRALQLLAIGVGDHTPVEVQEQVADSRAGSRNSSHPHRR